MAFPIIYIDTAGNGGAVTNSGSTDSSTPTVSGTATATVASTTVTFTGGPDLSTVPTDGSATIYIAGATNTNQRVFRITAVDNGAKTVTVDTAPTGSLTNVDWAIGGRQILPSSANLEGAIKAGWIVQINNTLAANAGTYLTCRNSGDSTSGPVWLRGKSGSRPVLNCTNTSSCITANNMSNWKVTNLELDQDGASGAAMTIYISWVVENVKVIDAGGAGFDHSAGNSPSWVINCDIAGTGGAGISTISNSTVVVGCYIHGCTGAGIAASGANPQNTIINNIIANNTGKGIHISTAANATMQGPTIYGNTIYGNGDSGYEATDTDTFGLVMNNIFSQNGNAAGEYNIEAAGGELHGYHAYNVLYHSGGGGGANLSGVTANSTELTSDPTMTNPASGDFSLQTGSPALQAGFPGFLGINGGTGYLDIGALQKLVTAGASGAVGVIGS